MAEQIQELISKIKSEGIESARKEADDIIGQAKEQADQIVRKAKSEAEQLKKEAVRQAEQTRQSTEKALQQASRDMVLNLRDKLENMLNAIVHAQIKEALTPEVMAGILAEIIPKSLDKKGKDADVTILLNQADLNKLKDGHIDKLQKKIKEGITFAPAEDIGSGFSISFDGGKSSFDFTDESLAEYLTAYLNPEMAKILEKAVKS